MQQILQNLSSGETMLVEVPAPVVQPGALRIATRASLVSVGTERMLLEFGRAGWLGKARQQPEKVRQVLGKVKSEGLFDTLKSVQRKLDEPIPLGYSNAGVVLEVGAGVDGFQVGDRVLCNGPHAEVVCVAQNLCAKIPDGVPDTEAAFGVVAAVSLQGIRLLQPTLGERVTVIGLGLLGLLAVQMLRANGCTVLGIDPDPERCALARSLGAEAHALKDSAGALAAAAAFAGGRGVDGVLITASTASDEPIRQAAEMCRQRGRIVLVGVTGLQLNRADFYAKELSFQVSCSYGPGRYDREYEERGAAYPFGLVRWTEQRNFEAVLAMMADGSLQLAPLVSQSFPIDRATDAYQALASEKPLGLVLTYPEGEGAESGSQRSWIDIPEGRTEAIGNLPCVAVIGAGNYVRQVLLPAVAGQEVRVKRIVSESGVSGSHLARRYGIDQSGTDVEAVFTDPEIDAVIIATRHDSHGSLVLRALEAGKHVYVEKPLAIHREEVEKIVDLMRPEGGDLRPEGGDLRPEGGDLRPEGGDLRPEGGDLRPEGGDLRPEGGDLRPEGGDLRPEGGDLRPEGGDLRPEGGDLRPEGVDSGAQLSHLRQGYGGQAGFKSQDSALSSLPLLMVGFNRRFSSHSQRLKSLLADRSAPLAIQYTVNAGAIPAEHWLHDRAIGGGRIIGEACHFVDWCRFICDAPIESIDCRYLTAADKPPRDSAVLTMQMADGSVATVQYLSNGHPKLPKERIEVFCGGSIYQLEDFRRLRGIGVQGFKGFKTKRTDKGHAAALEAFLAVVSEGGECPIPLNETLEVTESMLAL